MFHSRKNLRRRKPPQRTGRSRLQFECLESRAMLDGNGLLLSNDAYLTLSFATDGVSVAGQPNALAAKFNAIAPQSDWEDAIVRAFQTWAVQTNADIGVVPDSGQPFGSAGSTRGDSRFGDIRIAAIAMDPSIGGEATPVDRLVGGTWQADVLFNTNFNYQTINDIYEIALHEAGHVFGLEENTDPNSPMHSGTIPTAAAPTVADIASLQALYGTRLPDFNEQSGGGPTSSNDTFATATELVVDDSPGVVPGSAPSLAYGDITVGSDVDFFRLQVPEMYAGSLSVEVRSDGISLLTPRLQVYDKNRVLVEDIVSTSKRGDSLTFAISNATPDDKFYFEVSGATADVFGLGGYSIRATLSSIPQVDLSVLDSYLDRDLRKLSQDEIKKLLNPSVDDFLNEDPHDDDDLTGAIPLQSSTDFADPSRFEMLASISDATDSDFYGVRSPENVTVQADVLTVAIRTLSAGRLVPKINAFDRNLNPLPVTILANGGGEVVVQIGGIESDRNYYIEVGANDPAGPFNVGNYQLTASFRDQPANFEIFAASTLAADATQKVHMLYVAQPQLFHFLLQAGAAPGTAPAVIVASIYNEAGNLVHQLATPVGKTQSQGAVLLAPGSYTVRIASLTFQGSLTDPIDYILSGIAISDPFASDPNDQTTHPFANPDPTLGGAYLYPGGIITNDPFLWDSFINSLPNDPPPDVQTQVSLLLGNWWSWFWTETGANGPPLAQADSYATGVGTVLNASRAAGVFGNDLEPEGDPTAAVLVSAPRTGALQFNADGSFVYTPPAGFNGAVQFRYQTSDFRQLSNKATVSIAVGLIGDYDHSGLVDQLDYNVWRANYGSTEQLDSDGNGDGVIDLGDYVVWRKNQGLAVGASIPIVPAASVVAAPVAGAEASISSASVEATAIVTPQTSEPSLTLTSGPPALSLGNSAAVMRDLAPASASAWDRNLLALANTADSGGPIDSQGDPLLVTDIALDQLNMLTELPTGSDNDMPAVARDLVLANFWQSL